MSEQARIENAIDTTIDNCEVLRARLAKYEDADGNPKAQPSRVVLPPHCTDRAIPVKYRKGWNCCISEVARLNQPASAGDDQARAALSANHSEQLRQMVPDFYWVEADEGSWNSPEEWAQDYYDYNGEKPESVSFSCAVELPPREYDSFEFDADGNCISCRLVNTEASPSAGSQGGDV